MKWRENIVMKALAFMAAVAAFTATAIMSWYQLANFDALWTDAYYDSIGFAGGYTRTYLVRQDYWMVRYLVDLKDKQAAGQELTLPEKRTIERYEAEFDAGATNLRWQLLDKDGRVIYGNTTEDSARVHIDYWVDYRRGTNTPWSVNSGWEFYDEAAETNAVNIGDYDGVCYNSEWRKLLPYWVNTIQDGQADAASAELVDADGNSVTVGEGENTVLADEDGYTSVLRVVDSNGRQYVFYPTIRACLEVNQFGYLFEPERKTWTQTTETSEEEGEKDASLILWVDDALRVDDQYRKAAEHLAHWQADREWYLAGTIVLGTLGLLLTVYLCCGAGHKRGVEGIYLNWFHRLPSDILLCVLLLGGMGAVGIGVYVVAGLYGDAPMFLQLIGVGFGVAAAAALGLGGLLTVCARCKAHTLFQNTLIRRMCSWCWRKAERCIAATGAAAAAVPLIWKAVLGCMGYFLFTIVTVDNGNATGLWLLVTAGVSVYLCLWAYQWKRIRYGTQEIIRGNPNYHIRTERMLPDLRGHADELNNLGQAISAAVEDRLTSEHFKAELITNVSHDLKTPLTSIINYVDLLKKEHIDNPKAAEYIEVLDRKSQRLKKLTEDLVEASKASTGNLTVSWERLDLCQLTDQALGEYSERLEAQGLTVVRSLPEEPVWVEADGRHLWRVLENLLSNCAKYALAGTRVYIDLHRDGDWAVLSVKNISRDALDIPAERLMERFVQGDESRNASGSGLGLSIAQSLTELQRGQFKISIDGDLFKAIVTLPLLYEEPNGLIGFLP